MHASNLGERKLTEPDLDLLPLRQTMAPSGDVGLVFPRQELLERLSKPDRYRILVHGAGGGQILAASEFALAQARVLLQQAYGALVTFGAISVHTYVDPHTKRLMAPVMFVRIDAARAHMRELLEALEARAARLHEVDAQRGRIVIRAELEFCRALGLEREFMDVTDGSAHLLSWLLGYEQARNS
ncbi:MAG TPA: hypothetical protein VLJ86_00010 [Ramlibacter sp.]|nr:hypothetical protein [Ramlibacter sp.]